MLAGGAGGPLVLHCIIWLQLLADGPNQAVAVGAKLPGYPVSVMERAAPYGPIVGDTAVTYGVPAGPPAVDTVW